MEVRAREFAEAIVINVMDMPQLSEEQSGQVVCHRLDDGRWEFWAMRKAGLSEIDARAFDAWARERAYLLVLTADPEVDGWFRRTVDEGWQMTARKR